MRLQARPSLLILQRDVAGRDEVEIGYLFLREFRREGLATEAAVACREFGFGPMGQNRLISLIDPRNIASIRVAEKVGMRREATIERWDKAMAVYAMQNPSVYPPVDQRE